MKVFVTSVYDAKMKMFGFPKFYLTLGLAEREFTDEVNNPQSDIGKHPEDYNLFHLGSFETETGFFDNLTAPQSLVGAMSVKRVEV